MASRRKRTKLSKKEINRHFPGGVSSVAAQAPPEQAKETLINTGHSLSSSNSHQKPSAPQAAQSQPGNKPRLAARQLWNGHKKLLAACGVALVVLISGAIVYVFNRQPAVVCETERECFYSAYQSGCGGESFTKQAVSEEGAPITVQASLERVGSKCLVAVNVDASRDMFAPEPNVQLTCNFLRLTEGRDGQSRMWAEDCRGSQEAELVAL